MIILDTNVFIYLANRTLQREVIDEYTIAHASVTKIEALGFSRLPANELLLLKELFQESYTIPLTDPIIELAVGLRQLRRMSLGDAIVAATALASSAVLWTANTEDFDHIDGLKVFNPLSKT